MPYWRNPGLPTAARRETILVVDDDRDTRELYRAVFDLSGYVTAEAGSATEALAVAYRLQPDLLLTEFALPDRDGLAVAREFRRDARTAHARINLLTGYYSADLRYQAAAAGIGRALLKPCLPSAMLREVRRALRRNGAPRQRIG